MTTPLERWAERVLEDTPPPAARAVRVAIGRDAMELEVVRRRLDVVRSGSVWSLVEWPGDGRRPRELNAVSSWDVVRRDAGQWAADIVRGWL